MKVVPVPAGNLEATWAHWWPFVQAICARSKDSPSSMVRELRVGLKQVHLLWDEDARVCRGVLGSTVIGDGRVFHLIWATGKGLAPHWHDLLAQIEAYAREHCGCSVFKATARLGWSPVLKRAGYRTTHMVAEKDI